MPGFDIDAFHREAIETPSHDGVAEMRTFLVETLGAAGHEATVDEAGNVLASRGAADAGENDATHLVLNTHIDTVPPHVPYRSDPDADVVWGRGACDAKGPLAALLSAFIRADIGDGKLTLAITPDEETLQTGAGHLRETLSADGYIVGEPTELDVCTAARGQFEGTVTIHGESAHASDPADGLNAIRAAAPIMQAMESYADRHGPPEHETLGFPTLTPSMIEGGEAPNQIPGECTITFDRRSVPPERSDEFAPKLEAHLSQWLPEGMSAEVSLVHLQLNIFGLLGVTIAGVAYQFYPPAVAAWPGAGDRLAFWSLAGLVVGLLVVASTPLIDGPTRVLGHGLTTLSAVSYCYVLLATIRSNT